MVFSRRIEIPNRVRPVEFSYLSVFRENPQDFGVYFADSHSTRMWYEGTTIEQNPYQDETYPGVAFRTSSPIFSTLS